MGWCFLTYLMACFIYLPALHDQGTPNTHPHNPSMRIRNKNFSSYRKWDSGGRTSTKYPISKHGRWNEDGILLEIIGASFYSEEGKCLVPAAATCPGLVSAWFLPFLPLFPLASSRLLRHPTILPQEFKEAWLIRFSKGCRHPAQRSSMLEELHRFFFSSFVCVYVSPIKRLAAPTVHSLTKFPSFPPRVYGLYRNMERFCQPQNFFSTEIGVVFV